MGGRRFYGSFPTISLFLFFSSYASSCLLRSYKYSRSRCSKFHHWYTYQLRSYASSYRCGNAYFWFSCSKTFSSLIRRINFTYKTVHGFSPFSNPSDWVYIINALVVYTKSLFFLYDHRYFYNLTFWFSLFPLFGIFKNFFWQFPHYFTFVFYCLHFTIFIQKIYISKITMKKLLFILALILAPFSAFAQDNTITYNNPICSLSPNCNPGQLNAFIGINLPDHLSPSPNEWVLDAFCKHLWDLSLNSFVADYRYNVSMAQYDGVGFDGKGFRYYWQGYIVTKLVCNTNPPTPPPPPSILGCTIPTAYNYNPQATEDDGNCQAKIEWCTDITATNYNPQANVHVESMCIYPTPHTPQDITGYIDNTTVQSGATTWNITVNLNLTGATLDINKIQTWNKFTPINATTNDNKITITLQQFDWQRLNVECNNYELTIPRGAITTNLQDTNANPITGNFTVAWCPPTPTDTSTPTQSGATRQNAELNKNSSYLGILAQKDGVYYIDIKSTSYLFLYLLLGFTFIYILFKFIWKKPR